MKKIIFLSFIMSMSLAHAKIGSEGVGGGDLCEDRIKIVRDDIKVWIKAGGPVGLTLPAGMSVDDYSSSMLLQIEKAKVRCVSAGDEGFPVSVVGMAKVCRFDINADQSMITCDYNKFQAMKGGDQYLLVHHEYAGLAQVEIPNESDSDYSVSNQLSAYLVNERVRKLSIKPNALKSYDILEPYKNSRFAIALGIPGKKINFDMLSDLSIHELSNYVYANHMVNYLVDTYRNQILVTFPSETILYNFEGKIAGGNHYWLGLNELLISGLPNCMGSVGVSEGWKWSSALINIFLSDSCEESKVIVLDTAKLNVSIQAQLKKFVEKANLPVFTNGAMNIYVEGEALYRGQRVNRISYTYEIPKDMNSKVLRLETSIQLVYKNNTVTGKVLSVEQIAE